MTTNSVLTRFGR